MRGGGGGGGGGGALLKRLEDDQSFGAGVRRYQDQQPVSGSTVWMLHGWV